MQTTSGVAVGLATLSMRPGGQSHKSEPYVGFVKACSERMCPDKKELYLLVEQMCLRVIKGHSQTWNCGALYVNTTP